MFNSKKKLIKKLLKQKEESLIHVKMDLAFFRQCKKDYLSPKHEQKLRSKMEAESKKSTPSAEVAMTLEREINECTITRGAYEKTLKVVNELPQYIDMLNDQIAKL